jgi:hypothetical protein
VGRMLYTSLRSLYNSGNGQGASTSNAQHVFALRGIGVGRCPPRELNGGCSGKCGQAALKMVNAFPDHILVLGYNNHDLEISSWCNAD